MKAVNKFRSKQFVSEIKTKKTLKYFQVDNLRIGTTHLVWGSLDSTVSDMRKGVTKARILTGTYLLQKNKNSYSGVAVDPVCRHCRLEDEDLLHVHAQLTTKLENTQYSYQEHLLSEKLTENMIELRKRLVSYPLSPGVF